MDKRLEQFLEACTALNPAVAYDDVVEHLGYLESAYRGGDRHYRGGERHYHDLTHIDYCLEHAKSISVGPRGILALFYHDVVYDVTSKTNEEDSAAWFEDDASLLGFEAEGVEVVKAIILATKHKEEPRDAETAWVVDIDMSGLAASYSKFLDNDAKIRKEYACYDDATWKAGRTGFMQGLLAKDKIFYAGLFWEPGARQNIARWLKDNA